jgi:hypothetical protein
MGIIADSLTKQKTLKTLISKFELKGANEKIY